MSATPRSNARRQRNGVIILSANLNPWCAAPDQPWAASVAIHPNQPGEPAASFTYVGLNSEAGIYVLSTHVLAGRPEWSGVAELTVAVEQGHTRIARTFLVKAALEPMLIGFPFATDRGAITVSYSANVADLSHWAGSALHIEPPKLIRVLDEANDARLYMAAQSSGLGAMVSANQGGLANRLLPLLSTIDIASRAGRPSGTLWGVNAHCMAHLADLFDLDASGLITDAGDALVGVDRLFLDYQPTPNVLDMDTVSTATPLVVHSIRAITAAPFGRPTGKALATRFEALKPALPIAERLAAYDGLLLDQSIGMHIRRPFPNRKFGKLERSKFSLDDDFYRGLIADLKLHRPEVQNLFLATNDPTFELKLKAEFGGWIVTYDKRSIDNTRDAIAVQDALVDLILLSRCRAVISARKSDFGFAAALFGQRPLYRLGEYVDGAMHVELWRNGEQVAVRTYRRHDAKAFGSDFAD